MWIQLFESHINKTGLHVLRIFSIEIKIMISMIPVIITGAKGLTKAGVFSNIMFDPWNCMELFCFRLWTHFYLPLLLPSECLFSFLIIEDENVAVDLKNMLPSCAWPNISIWNDDRDVFSFYPHTFLNPFLVSNLWHPICYSIMNSCTLEERMKNRLLSSFVYLSCI